MTKQNRAARKAAQQTNAAIEAIEPQPTNTAIVAIAPEPQPEPIRAVAPEDAEDGIGGVIPSPEPEPKPKSAKCGVLPRKYHERYTKQGGNNGDGFAIALRDTFTVRDPKTGDESTDRAALIAWAKQAGFWVDRYETLNTGMVRMNVGNRARSAIRNGVAVELAGTTYSNEALRKG